MAPVATCDRRARLCGWPARLAVGLAVVCAATMPAAAASAPGCANRLIEDWADGRIDATYPAACYRQAVIGLPEDLRAYSTAEDDIRAALFERLRGASRTARTSAGERPAAETNPATTTQATPPARALAGAEPAEAEPEPHASSPVAAPETPGTRLAERGPAWWPLVAIAFGLAAALVVWAVWRRRPGRPPTGTLR